MKRKIRVLVVDDSALVRRLIPGVLNGSESIEVVGTAADPYEARDRITTHKPDLLTLDIEMPRMDGLTFLKILMEKHPMPVVVLSSSTQEGSSQALEALRLGAMDVLPKTGLSNWLGQSGTLLAERIQNAMTTWLSARVPRRVRPGSSNESSIRKNIPAGGDWNRYQVGLIGASTGGTEALRRVMAQFPADFPGICIVQHIPAFVSRAFAERLNTECAMEVREARDGDVLHRGLALIAPGDRHMTVTLEDKSYVIRLNKGPKVWYQRPAVDVLFRSAASVAGRWGLGVLLTGMGRDGAEGLLHLKENGAQTLAQDEATSVVYGMPKVALELGAVDHGVPLDSIPGKMHDAFIQQLQKNQSAMGVSSK